MQKPTPSRVLLADDDRSVREALGDLLDSEGYEVIRAENGHDALVKFCEHHADIVILDLMMPVKGGSETSHWLRSISPFLPIIIITARHDAHRALMAAGTVLLHKPVHIPILLEAIRDLLASHQAAKRRGRDFATQPFERPADRRSSHLSPG
jgi:DNA-binding response OmpR family regulator